LRQVAKTYVLQHGGKLSQLSDFKFADVNAALTGTKKVQPWHVERESLRPSDDTAAKKEVAPRLAATARPDIPNVCKTEGGCRFLCQRWPVYELR